MQQFRHNTVGIFQIDLRMLQGQRSMGCECEYCGSVLTTRTNLLKHQRITKYCLKLQGKQAKKDSYTCHYCGNVYMHIDSFNRHQKQCKPQVDPDDKLEKLVVTMTELQNRQIDTILTKMMDILATNSTNVNNNRNVVLNNLAPLTDEQLSENLEHLTLNFIQAGAKGYADFANCYPLKDNVVCTDKARKKIRYKNEEGEITDDSRELTKRFFTVIQPKNEEIINTEYRGLHEQIQDIVAENKAGDVDITTLFNRASELQNLLLKCRRAAKGEDEEFTQEFIKHLTRTL